MDKHMNHFDCPCRHEGPTTCPCEVVDTIYISDDELNQIKESIKENRKNDIH